jgi:putative hydrolase of the HAD superfamily
LSFVKTFVAILPQSKNQKQRNSDSVASAPEFFIPLACFREAIIIRETIGEQAEDMCRTILFDFGGVLAEEGFRDGLKAIAKKNGIDQDNFYAVVDRLIYESGYLTGKSDELSFWKEVRERTGVRGTDQELREEILSRFILRPDMITSVDRLRARRFVVALLSDQTNWLEEIDRAVLLFRHFDHVFNSWRMHMSKRDESVFAAVCREIGVSPQDALFIDDNENHIKRADRAGLATIHYTTFDDYSKKMSLMTAEGAQS